MNQLADHLYTRRPPDLQFFKCVLADELGGMPDYFGQYRVYDGKGYGLRYKPGTIPGTFSSEVYEAGKRIADPGYTFDNKTLDQLDALFNQMATREQPQEGHNAIRR